MSLTHERTVLFLFFWLSASLFACAQDPLRKKAASKAAQNEVTKKAERPNIVFLFADDMRPDAIKAFGHPIIETPHLDQLAKSGTVFTRAITAYPICHVSRAEIFSGRSAFRSGYFYRGKDYSSDVVLWPEAMKAGGYKTLFVGKWHSPRTPWKCGFNQTRGLFSSGGASKVQKRRLPNKQVDYKGLEVTGYKGWTFKNDDNKPEPEKGIGLTPDISEHFVDAAIEFIEQKHDRPFFLQVSFTAPHDPLLIPTGYEGKYDPATIPLPKNFKPRHSFDHGNFNGRDEKLAPWPREANFIKRDLAVYYAITSHLDEQVGRIVRSLRKSGKYANTVIVFSSDHGLALGSHGLMGKQNQYEHTIGVPLMFTGAGIPKNKKVKTPCYLRDLYPTICDLTQTRIPPSVESKSLADLIAGRSDPPYEFVTGYFTDTQRMIREENWKLIWYPKLNRYQLFDLQTDPHELKNLVTAKRVQEKFVTLRERLEKWLKDQGDPLFDDKD